MKKAIAMMLGIALVAAVAKKILAVDNQDVTVVMSIQSIDLTVDGASLLPVAAKAGQYKIIPGHVVVANTGNVNEDFSLRITSVTGIVGSTWNVVEVSTPGTNEVQLHAIFAMYKANPTISTNSFSGADDYLATGTYRTSSANNFWCQTCSSFDVGFSTAQDDTAGGGYNVGINGFFNNQRVLYLRFGAGQNPAGNKNTATINILATETPGQ